MPSISSTTRGQLIVPVYSPTINSGSEFLSNLPTAESFPAKTVILEQHERPTFVRLIRSGIVKLTYTNEEGEELLLGLRSEGWWAGANLALLDVESLVTVTTISPCTITNIPVDDFSQKLAQNQRMLRHFISGQCRELLAEQKHSIMRGHSAVERLEYMEQEQISSLWVTIDPNAMMRQGEIAQLLSISPEHLSRLLRGRLDRRRAAYSHESVEADRRSGTSLRPGA